MLEEERGSVNPGCDDIDLEIRPPSKQPARLSVTNLATVLSLTETTPPPALAPTPSQTTESNIPETYSIFALVVVVLCGFINPCALLALKKTCDAARSLQNNDIEGIRRNGIAAKYFAIGGIILGALVLSLVYYKGIIKALNNVSPGVE